MAYYHDTKTKYAIFIYSLNLYICCKHVTVVKSRTQYFDHNWKKIPEILTIDRHN